MKTRSAPPADRVLYRFRRSALGPANFLDLSGFYSLDCLANYIPLRGLVVSGLVITLLFLVGLPASDNVLHLLLVIALSVPPGVELLCRQDFLTPEAVVRQSGLLGRRRLRISLDAIESVVVSYPRYGAYFSVADVILKQATSIERLVGIKHPEAAARYVLEAKEARDTTPAASHSEPSV